MFKLHWHYAIAATLFALAPLMLCAQGSQDQGIRFDLFSPTLTAAYEENKCSFLGARDWGGTVQVPLCGELVWAKDWIGHDSLCCDSIPEGLYTGKIALIRRGGCEFARKAFFAQHSGAIAVIIVNHFANTAEDGCTVLEMPSAIPGLQVSIPVFFACRDLGNMLDQAVKSGTARLCLSRPQMTQAVAPYHVATPLSQITALKDISVSYTNYAATPEDSIILKVTFIAPDGSQESMTKPLRALQPGENSVAVFPPYKPKAQLGKHTAVFTCNRHTDARDTLRRNFYYTPYTYATDNLTIEPLGVGIEAPDFGIFYLENGSLYRTGDTPVRARYATFGLANATAIYIPGDPWSNRIYINLYDADIDGDGVNNLKTSFEYLSDAIVAQGLYQIRGNEGVDSLLTVPLYDFINPALEGVTLKPNHAYYLTLAYDGTAGVARSPYYSKTRDEYYPDDFYATPLFIGNLLYPGGWKGAEVIQRLQLDGFIPTIGIRDRLLEPVKIQISPNPATEQLLVNLALAQQNDAVTLALLSARGLPVRTRAERNFSAGVISMQIQDLPAGMYSLWVCTDEGSRIEKVVICH